MHLIDDTALSREFPRPRAAETPPATRQADGRFAAPALSGPAPLSDTTAAAIVSGYFTSTCKLMGLDLEASRAALQLPHSPSRMLNDRNYRSAAYARQLAMYLTATEGNVTQAQIARVTGLSDAAVHKALRTVEDLRDDHADYEQLISEVLVDVAMTGEPCGEMLVGRARRLAKRNRKETT